MKIVIKIIHVDQTGFVKNRSILTNVALVTELIKTLKDSNIVTFLDFAKAFDKVSHKYMWTLMEKMNFGDKILNCLKETYLNSFSQILYNGKLTDTFQILRGVRQGDPLSTLLFIMAVEPLLEKIRRISKGIMLKSTNKKVNAHADDTTLFNKDEKDQEKTLEAIKQFCKISSGELNLGKCKAISNINKDKINSITKLGKDDLQRNLGYKVCLNMEKVNNVKISLEKFKDSLQTWKKINPSIIGRFEIVQSYALPKLMYGMYYSQKDKNIIKEIENIIKWFLFSNSYTYDVKVRVKSKISLKRLSLSKSVGGNGVKSIEFIWSSLQTNFIMNSLKKDDTFTEFLFSLIKDFEKETSENLYEIFLENKRKRLKKAEFKQSILKDCIQIMLKIKMRIIPKIVINKYYFNRLRNEMIKIKDYDPVERKGKAINSQKETYEFNNKDGLEIVKSKHFEKIRTPYFFEIFGEIEEFNIDGNVNTSKTIYNLLIESITQKEDLKSNSKLEKLDVDITKRLKALKHLKITNNVKSFHFNVTMNNIMIEINRHYPNKPNSRCQICKESDEDYEHLLERCKIAKIVNDLTAFENIKTMKWYEWELNGKIIPLKLIKDFIIWKFRCQKVIGKRDYNKEAMEKEALSLIQRHESANWINNNKEIED
jgi:hypothetical protein